MVNKLREKLLVALENDGNQLISETTNAVLSTLDCDMCTLWSINHNPDSKALGNYDSASLVIRRLRSGEKYPNHNQEDYAHELRNSFIEHVINVLSNSGGSYLFLKIDDEDCKKHFSYNALVALGLNHLLCIPIWNKDRSEIHAFVKLAFKEAPTFMDSSFDILEEMTDVISNAYVSALSRNQLFQKQQIVEQLIENYRKDRSTLKDVFHPVIHRIFKNYFDYEGASVFIWDSFDNRFNLLSTTGLEPYTGTAFYENGEGLTSEPASEKKAKIYDNLVFLEDIRYPGYLHKYREVTHHRGKSLLAVPILRPSNTDNVIGIIRFTNKINKQSREDGVSVIDCFNNNDVELIKHASHYLALNIENYLAEQERKDFISKMSHEFKTPANAIRVTAQRALRKYQSGDTRFMQSRFERYMQNIIDFASLQIMQVTTNLFMTKSSKINKAKAIIGNYPILDIIRESIDIIRPIARENSVSFGNIYIAEDFPNITLKVDKNAFKMVFYNLLTNAIKYHGEEFYVLFSAKETSEGLVVHVSDRGIGIAEEDTSRIFLLGVRSKNAMKVSAGGYGIGLHVAKLIINTFGGTIRVSSNSNPTTFEVLFPRVLYT